MKRPVGVVLSAILLGLLAAFDLLGVAASASLGFLTLKHKLPAPPSASAAFPAFLTTVCFIGSFIAIALGVWCVWTLVGLIQLRSWARYSVLVIGGCITAFGVLAAASCFALPYLTRSAANLPPSSTEIVRGISILIGTCYTLFAGLGASLLAYFNLAKTRRIFLSQAPVLPAIFSTSTGQRRPTAVTVISWIYLVSAPFCFIYLLLPTPAFLFGLILHGWAARLVYAGFGVVGLLIGYGLFALHNNARVAVFALFPLGLVQLMLVLTPWGGRQFLTYMDEVNAWSAHLSGMVQPNIFGSIPVIAVLSLLGMAGYGVILWLLHRHRASFRPAPPAPPLSEAPHPATG